MKSKRIRQSKPENQSNADRWLLTYADLITLLLGLFVILYAMSQVDNTKYSKVVVALGGMFGKAVPLGESESVLPGGALMPDRMSIERKLHGALYQDLQSQLVSVSQDSRGVVVHLAEELLFASGSATLKNTSTGSLDLLASVLKTLPNEIRVEGHTDNVPISTTMFPSNWHLSVGRAMNTGDYLMKRHGIDPQKVTIVGFSEYKPLVPNTTQENKARNRRVDIVIVSSETLHNTKHSGEQQ
ncbi:MAG: OmpA family protein [Bacteroidetes bacterium]|nr:OmpA family protein [Bacteroidota bacterium]MCW5895079.1 OmpA family protein [Bacteroidota bacterium]